MNGPTWDGDLISKADRNEGVESGFLISYKGWTTLTKAGLLVCLAAEYDREKERRDRQRSRSAT